MRRFEFRLQPALNHRQRIEDRLRIEYAEIQTQALRLKEEVRRLERRRDEALRPPPAGETLDLDAERRRADYLEALTQELRRLRAEAETVARALEAKRLEVLAASQDRRALEKVKEQRQAEHRRDALREEQKQLDDLRPAPVLLGTAS